MKWWKIKFVSRLVFIPFLFGSLRAQEVGAGPNLSWTTNLDLQNPLGFAVYYLSRQHGVAFRVEVLRATNEVSRRGPVEWIDGEAFQHGVPVPTPENLRSRTDYLSLNFGPTLPDVLNLKGILIGLGLGVSFNHFEVVRNGLESGRSFTYSDPNRAGLFLLLSISHEDVFLERLKTELKVSYDSLGSFVSTGPFEDILVVKHAQFTLAYVF